MANIPIKSGGQLPVSNTPNVNMGTFIVDPANDRTYYVPWSAISVMLGVSLSSSGIMGIAISTTNPITTGTGRYLVNAPATFTNFRDNTNTPITVTAGDISSGIVELWGTNNIWEKHITIVDLSAYVLKSEFNPVADKVTEMYNELYETVSQSDTIGHSYFSPTAGLNVDTRFILNRGQYSNINGVATMLRARFYPQAGVTTGTVTLLHLRRAAGVYTVFASYPISVLQTASTQETDLTSLGINVQQYDAFALQCISAAQARVGTATVAGFGYSAYASTPSGAISIPEEIVMTPSGGDIVATFDVIVQSTESVSKFEELTTQVGQNTTLIQTLNTDVSDLDELVQERTVISNDPQIEGVGFNVVSTNNISSTTVCIVNKNVVTIPGAIIQRIELSANTLGNPTGTINLVHLRNISSGYWQEVNRFPLTCVNGDNSFDFLSNNVSVMPNDCFGVLSTSTAQARYLQGGAATGRNNQNATLSGSLFEFTNPNFPNISGTITNQVVDLLVTVVQPLVEQTVIEKIGDIDQEIEELSGEISMIGLPSGDRGTVFYENNFATIPSDWINTTWATVTDGVSPSEYGLDKFLKLNKQYALSNRSARCRVVMGTNTRFLFYTTAQETSVNLQTIFEMDASANMIRIYAPFNGTTLPAVLSEKPFTFVPGREYICEISKADFAENTIRVIDTVSGIPETLTDITNGSGRQHDNYALCCLSGTFPIVKDFSVRTDIKRGEWVWVAGDSITEARYTPNDLNTGYAFKLVQALDGSGSVSGRGGGTINGVLRRLETELQFLKPRYAVIMIGTNFGNTESNLTQLINRIRELNVIPILCNVPREGNGDDVATNTMIDTVKASLNVKGAKMHNATSINYDPSQPQDQTLYNSDSGAYVHPNLQGMQNMFNRFIIDTPELFD